MTEKDLLKQMAMAMASEDWAKVAQTAQLLAGSGQAQPETKTKAKRKTPVATEPASGFVNKFKDDLTLEKGHVASDKKILKKVKPSTRRPPSQNRKPVDVVCPKCGGKHSVPAIEVAMRRDIDSGLMCPGCMRGRGR